ncbi:hypothetical protein [Nitrospira sp. Nam74]
MKHCGITRVNRVRPVWWAAPVSLCLYLLTSGISQAGGFTSPQECQAFTGDDHLNCLYSYIARQQTHNDAVNAQRKAHEDTLQQFDTPNAVEEHAAVLGERQGETTDRKDMPHSAPAPPSSAGRVTPAMGSPAECRAYSGAAHLNCLYAYIEIQNSKAGHVEEELQAQKQMLGQLRDQMDRQAAANQDLQRRLAERDTPSSSPSPGYVAPPIFSGYPYPYGYPWYGYPAPGLSLYLGVPGYYWGRPFYGPRFFGPRFYGHHHRR